MTGRRDEHFLAMAEAQCGHSPDPNTRVGAVIVGPYDIPLATGFNSFPRLICETPDRLNDRDLKLRLIVHAEMKAILAAGRFGIPVVGCTLFLAATDDTGLVWGGPPCTRCTVELIEAGIAEVVSRPRKPSPSRWHADLDLAASLLAEAGVTYREVAHG